MDNRFDFRPLRPDEIECRVQSVNKGGVVLLLYKDARVDQNLLDETFGIFGWQRRHEMIGDRLYCTVSVRDPKTGEWISKQDVGTESYTEKEKGQASDSFKRACFNLGIGRALYTAPNIFIKKDSLASYKDDGTKPTCNDTFKVKDITYSSDGKSIVSVVIDVIYYDKVKSTLTFTNNAKVTPIKATSSQPAEATKSAESAPAKTEPAAASDTLSDSEVILLGNCRGKTYGDAKGTTQFASFLNWVKTSSSRYDDPKQQRQFDIFKKLAKEA
ncbi:MAG: hypothetical protein K6G10_06845 [Butyrivibrio sp.]|nr:hypothetical protein [Butyrivibrio sp.]